MTLVSVDSTALDSGPASNEIEVSVFGRGYGEAIVIHAGGGRWIAIDSVGLDGGSLSATYLEAIGVDLSTQVDTIIATHWHDDHVKGIASLFALCPAAEFVYPSAMLKDEFIRFAAAFSGQKSKFSSGLNEFGDVLATSSERRKVGSRFPLRQSRAGMVVFRRPTGDLPHRLPVQIEALSPSSFDEASFLLAVANTRPDPAVLQRAPFHSRNDVSSAFWLQIGADAVLLGADVEATSDPDTGWNGILSNPLRPTSKASLVKVPHHGGRSGHHQGMWTDLVEPNSTAVLTPWTKGGNRLPTRDDVARLRGLIAHGYATGPSMVVRDTPQPSIVAKVLRKDHIRFRRIADEIGHVRHRAVAGDGRLHWQTELFGRACLLQQIAA